MNQARLQKGQREKARREKAAAKSARKQARRDESEPEVAPPTSEEASVLAQLAALHERFDAGEVTFDEFELAKAELTECLDVG